MTKQDFIENLPEGTKIPTDSEFELINSVILWHPSISRDYYTSRNQVARLYTDFGMGIIKDMLARVNRIMKLHDDIEITKDSIKNIECDLGRANEKLQRLTAELKIITENNEGVKI